MNVRTGAAVASIAAAIVGAILLWTLVLHRPSSGAALPLGMPHQSTVSRVAVAGSTAKLLVRSSATQLTAVRLRSSTKVVSRDGHTLALGSIRPGDTLQTAAHHSIKDLSQMWVNLAGVVAYVPGTDPDLLVVQLTPSRMITVDVDAGTHLSDTHQPPASQVVIADADQIKLDGMLDGSLGEMTQTATIVRVGPKLTKAPGTHSA